MNQYDNYSCIEHPSELITNFCSLMECLKPLCPECIDNHTKYHKKLQTYPDIDSLKNVKSNCHKKVQMAVGLLYKELETLKFKSQYLREDSKDQTEEQIKKCRDQMLNMVNDFFDTLELQRRRLNGDSINISQDLTIIHDKIKSFINELEYLNAGMDSSSSVSILKKICQLDLKANVENFKFEIQSLYNNNKSQNIRLIANDVALKNFEKELQKCFKIDTFYDKPKSSFLIDDSPRKSDLFIEGVRNHNLEAFPDYQKNFFEKGNLSPAKHVDQQIIFTSGKKNQRGSNGKNFSMFNVMQEKLTMPDYFSENCNKKLLHFFPNGQKKLYIVSLEKIFQNMNILQKDSIFKEIDLKINFTLPRFHKSIQTPDGSIYVIGGSSNESPGKKVKTTFIYQEELHTLKNISECINGRSSHSICYMDDYIYMVGGFLEGQEYTSYCERLDLKTRIWKPISPMIHNVVACCLVPYNQRSIFKFGGLINGVSISQFIEKYDVNSDLWSIINITIDHSDIKSQSFKLLSTSAGCQISQNEILIFGGYEESNDSSNYSFVLYQQGQNYIVKKINKYCLPFSEGFWNNNPIVQNGFMFALQNIPNESNDDCMENVRRILIFNGESWKSINQETLYN